VENPGAPDQPDNRSAEAAQAMLHVRALSETIGPRPSCSPEERSAAAYAADRLAAMGWKQVTIEAASGAASAYTRYALISGLAAAATLIALLFRYPVMQSLAVLLQLAAAQAMLLESDFRRNGSRWLIPDRDSQNVIARQEAMSSPLQTIVLMAHLDTARTPAFNASRRGQHAYLLLFRGIMISFLAAALLHVALAILAVPELAYVLLGIAGLQLSSSLLLTSFERTPYSPGAYDNASGAACILALAGRLQRQPLDNSEIWICFTGCEETGAGGAVDLFDRHAPSWKNPWIINLDQLGYSRMYLRTEEGLIRRYRTSAACLALAQQVANSLPGLDFTLRPSQAFSDAAPAHQRGLRAFSLGSAPTEAEAPAHRHQISDLPEHLSESAFTANLCYIWSLIQALDTRAEEALHG
jgi:hypothetical protein